MNVTNSDRILILGSSSWLGYLLLDKLKNKGDELAGTYHKNKVDFGKKVLLYNPLTLVDYKNLLNDFHPTVIVNFLRGEDQLGKLIHSSIIDYVADTQAYYLYASSILALDGYDINVELRENLTAYSKSTYGIFKAECEQNLYNSNIDWCILRFASVQGWVPHKLTRNEFFLQKLSKGIKTVVDQGVLQNRMFANLMVDGILDIINNRVTGIIHFGTSDSSEEIDFLRKQAELFGFSPKLVIEGKIRKVNLVAVSERIYNLFGSKYLCSQEDTLKSLYKIKNLRNYIKEDYVNTD
jgi:dTDP-4-dehydrorhamnose reductase